MEDQAYYSDQSTYDEEDYYRDEFLTEAEEEYGPEANMEKIDPKPPDYAYDQSENTKSSTWSQPYKTPYTSNSVIYIYPSRHTAPKIQLYAFSGKRSYLEWEENMDDWFYYNQIREEKRLVYAIEQLSGDAYKWWVQEKAERKRYNEPTITTWKMLKELLRKKYAPKRRIGAEKRKAKTDHDKEVAGRNRVDDHRAKRSSDQNQKLSDQRSKHQALQIQAELREKKFEEDIKKCIQEVLENMEAFKKKKHVTHRLVDTKANKEPMVDAENVKAKLIPQTSLESMCEPEQCKSSNLSKYKGATCYTCREKGHIAETCLRKTDLNIILDEPKLSSSNSSSEVVNDGLEQSNSCIMRLFLSREVDSGHTLEHESDKSKESTKENNQLALHTSNQRIEVEQSDQHEALNISNILCGTQVSLACELIHYLNNINFTRSLKQSVLNFEISSIIHLILPLSAKENSGSIDECKSLERTTTARSLTFIQTENPTSFVQEHLLMSIPYIRKHCKEVDLVDNGPNLFVIVSMEEEKRFELENIKEFRISSSVFDNMIPYFKTLTLEEFSMQIGFMVDDLYDFSTGLRVSLCNHLFDMFRAKTKYALFRTWHELDYLFRNLLIEPCELKNHELELNHLKTPLSVLGNENKLNHLRGLIVCSKRTFDVLSLVFVKDKQVHDSREKVIQLLSNQVDYGPTQALSYHFKFWNWKYLRKETPTRSSRILLKHTRREDDQRFKPPDLVPARRLILCLYIQIKEEPPDETSKPATRLHIFGGNFLVLVYLLITNLMCFYADNLDLRTNPFQVGEDDMIMGSSTSNFVSRLDCCNSSSTSAPTQRGNDYETKEKSN